MSEHNPLLSDLEVVRHTRTPSRDAAGFSEPLTLTSGITVTCSITVGYPTITVEFTQL